MVGLEGAEYMFRTGLISFFAELKEMLSMRFLMSLESRERLLPQWERRVLFADAACGVSRTTLEYYNDIF